MAPYVLACTLTFCLFSGLYAAREGSLPLAIISATGVSLSAVPLFHLS